MKLALKEAKKSLVRGGIPVGAVIVKNGRVVARGRRAVRNKAFLDHAETVALRDFFKKFGRSPEGLSLYTTVEPCAMCFGTILHAKIGKIVYALKDPFGGATTVKSRHLPLRHRSNYPQITGGVLERKSKKLMQDYLKITKSKFWLNKRNPMVRFLLNK